MAPPPRLSQVASNNPYEFAFDYKLQLYEDVVSATHRNEAYFYQSWMYGNNTEFQKCSGLYPEVDQSQLQTPPFPEVRPVISPRRSFRVHQLPPDQSYFPVVALYNSFDTWTSSSVVGSTEAVPGHQPIAGHHLHLPPQSVHREQSEPTTPSLGRQKRRPSEKSTSTSARGPPPCRPNMRLPTPELPDLLETPFCTCEYVDVDDNDHSVKENAPDVFSLPYRRLENCHQNPRTLRHQDNRRFSVDGGHYTGQACTHGHNPKKDPDSRDRLKACCAPGIF